MTITTVESGGWAASFSATIEGCMFPEARQFRHLALPASAAPESARAVLLVVELVARRGGLRSCALLGGEYVPNSRADIQVDIWQSGALTLGAAASCHGFSGHGYVPGLADEFADAVEGTIRERAPGAFPAGQLTVNIGGYDEVESNGVAFRNAAHLLVIAMPRVVLGQDYKAAASSAMSELGG